MSDPQKNLSDAERLLAAIPEPAILIGPEEEALATNEAARALFPLLGDGAALRIAVRAPDIHAAAASARRDGQATAEHVERQPVERRYAVEARLLPGGGEALLLFRDRTSELAAERMRSDFVANASHELRTPLTALIGFIETLQGAARNDADARDRFLAMMADQARRMARLIDDLLSLSRVEMHRHLAPSTPVVLDAVAREAVEALRMLARDRGAGLDLAIEGGPFEVAGDRDELYRVIENLVENALKYGRKGGRTGVVLRPAAGAEEQVEISVRDDGPGIGAQHLPRLTERFYRVDAKESRQKGGTGLGLALVKHIVGRHRGRLEISSTVGQGSIFTVRLPRRG